jgi:hypothetical protein
MIRNGYAIARLAVLMVLASTAAGGITAAAERERLEQPETMIVTLHAKPGAEAELAAVIARHWDTAQRLNLVLPSPHVTVRGTEADDRTYFVDIFTWRDAAVPDHAPPEIQKIWADMNRLVEAQGNRPGLEFSEVFVVHK